MSEAKKINLLNSLKGLRVGDAFGFKLSIRPQLLNTRTLPEGPWRWSDDTLMAVSVAEQLLEYGHIQQDELFASFTERFLSDPQRGYGAGMKRLLGSGSDASWRTRARSLFRGEGSLGNGGAMRVAPLGAYFAGDLARVREQASLSASVTHAHEEGIAGAIAVAIAAAIVTAAPDIAPGELLDEVARQTPPGRIRQGLERACAFERSELVHAAEALGNGSKITAADTVPLCVWWAAHNLQTYEEAMWELVAIKGDEDTNCAIVGGILGAAGCAPPAAWEERAEPLPPLSRAS